MKPIVWLYCDPVMDRAESAEAGVSAKYLPTVNLISEVPLNSLVIGRYTVGSRRYYRWISREIQSKGGRLINSPDEHDYIADVAAYAPDLGHLTPQTWTTWADLPEGAYIVKGRENSRKFQWATHMFSATREDVPRVAARLLEDPLINHQGLVVREYIPLHKLDEGLYQLPISNEWRCFFYKERLLAKGFYWASHPEDLDKAFCTPEAEAVAIEARRIVSEHVPFFVLDVAETADGRWIIIEINDAQMSGLSMVIPEELYSNLAAALS